MGYSGNMYAQATEVITSQGDLRRGDSSGNPERLAIGSSGKVLQSNGTTESWQTLTTADSVLTTAGDVLFENNTPELARLPKGSDADVMTLASGLPSWVTPSAGGGWTHLTTKTLTGAASLVTDTFTAKNYLHIVAFAARDSADTQGWQFNDDTGNNYDNNRSYNFGASTVRDDKPCISTDGINTDDYFHATFMDFINLAAYDKYGYASDQRQSTGTDGSMDTQQTSLCWQNTSEQITKITGVDHEGNAINYKENSFIIVFGRD